MALAKSIDKIRDTDTIVVNRDFGRRNGGVKGTLLTGLEFKEALGLQTIQTINNTYGDTFNEVIQIITQIINEYELPERPDDDGQYYLELNTVTNELSWVVASSGGSSVKALKITSLK